jgi:prepilin-type N-terminal cleavage/methylation domain-containing protein
MRQGTAGFSLLEMMFVLVIAAILLTLVVPGLGSLLARRNAQNARDAYVWLGMQARTLSMEQGQQIELRLDPDSNQAEVLKPDGSVVQKVDFASTYGVELSTSSGDVVTVCYTPRGFALSGCPGSEQRAGFRQGRDTAWALVRVLGQVVPQ